MIIRDEVFIHAPLETVWKVFSSVDHWHEWNPVCRECRLISGDGMAPGACISFELNPLVFPLRIAPEVKDCRPGRSVTWAGAKWGVYAEHTFNFEAAHGGIKLKSIESFSGVMLWPARLIGVPKRLQTLTRRLLIAIKKAAEAHSENER